MRPCIEDTRQKRRDRAVRQSGCNNVESSFAYVCIKQECAINNGEETI